MTAAPRLIREDDFVASIADGLQYIAVYHPPSFIRALAESHAREESPAARDAMAQILINSRMAAFGRRPICQDTGVVNVFVKIGMGARIDSERPSQTLSTRRCARRTPTRTILCAPRLCAIRSLGESIHATTRRRSSTSTWWLAMRSS